MNPGYVYTVREAARLLKQDMGFKTSGS